MGDRIEEIINAANKHYMKFGRCEIFIRLEDQVVQMGIADYMYYFAHDVKGADIKKFSKAIAMTGNADFILYFAEEVPGADIKVLQEAMIKTNEAKYIYYFARNVKGADVKLLKSTLLKLREFYEGLTDEFSKNNQKQIDFYINMLEKHKKRKTGIEPATEKMMAHLGSQSQENEKETDQF